MKRTLSRSCIAAHETSSGLSREGGSGLQSCLHAQKLQLRSAFGFKKYQRYVNFQTEWINSNETAFVLDFQFPNGPACVSARVWVCGNPTQKRSSSAGKHCAYNLINNKKYVNLIRGANAILANGRRKAGFLLSAI